MQKLTGAKCVEYGVLYTPLNHYIPLFFYILLNLHWEIVTCL